MGKHPNTGHLKVMAQALKVTRENCACQKTSGKMPQN
jgi:hypothetical protein